MEFYNVKKKAKVKVAEKDCKKVIYKRETANGVQERYAVQAVDNDGVKLTRFVNKAAFDELKCPLAK